MIYISEIILTIDIFNSIKLTKKQEMYGCKDKNKQKFQEI